MDILRLHHSWSVASVALSVALLSPAALVRGQELQPDQAPAHLAYVDGAASLDREGATEPATAGVPFVPGDRLRTDSGRAEILFPDSSVLDIDQFTSIDLLSPTLIRVTEGRILLTVAGTANPAAAVRYQIDTPTASATTEGPGEYRVALVAGPGGDETELAVVRGLAALTTERGSINLRAGERSLAPANSSPSYPQIFNSARHDAFTLWADRRRLDRTRTTTSTQYLPNELQVYGSAFDRHGTWRYEPSYGNVWYPSVAFDWRPYYNGYWSPIRPFGWTWIGFDVWAWPTHHYGRWGHVHNRWFWVPKPHWGAAWVSWGTAPGYVSWCPLGFDNRPVFGPRVVGGPWAGWVVVPRTHFATRHVSQWAVAPHRLHRNTQFAIHSTPPVAPTYAVRRGDGVGTLTAGRAAAAVPRGGATSASQQTPGGFPQRSAETSQRARNPQAASRQGFDGVPARADRVGSSAVQRRSPTGSTLGVPPESPRAYQRRPTAPQFPAMPDTDAAGRPLRSAVPRWSLPGVPANTEAMRPPQQPAAAAAPTAAIPRWRLPGSSLSGGDVQAAPQSDPGAGQRWRSPGGYVPRDAGRAPGSAPARAERWGYGSTPQSRPSPESAPGRSPGMAVPRGGPPPASTSGDGTAGQPATRAGGGNGRSAGNGGSAGGGGGVRQRHP
jgi:hypothetical protein